MNGKIIACAFSIICLSSIFTFGQKSLFQDILDFKNEPFGFETLNPQPSYQTLQITEDIAYEQLFRLISSFEKQADKQIKEGQARRAEFLRSYLQRKAGLSFEQAKALKGYAPDFTTEFGCLSNRGEINFQTEKYNAEKLNNERSQALLEYRNRIRQLLGESGFDEFNKFVQKEITSRITYGKNSKPEAASFGFSMVDYDYQSNEVLGYSYTDEPGGHCQVVTNIVSATLTSDAEGEVDSADAEVCDGGAEVYLYFSNPQPEDRLCVDGEHQYANTYYPQLNDWTFGLNNKSTLKSNFGYCYYEKTESLPPSEACLTTPQLPNVTSVDFQLIQQGSAGIDTNPNAEGGRRIFPDDDTPGDTVNRQQIRVTARISENRAGVPIYFGNFDLDDPSADMTIDPNGDQGSDNNGEVNGNSAGQLSAVSAVTNGNGEASVNFTVTRQPGDNFAIAASTNRTALGSVTVNGTALINGSGASIDINCDGTDAVCRSEMLTVWRRLHIEVDSMRESDGNFVNGNFAQSARVGVTEVDVQVNTSQPLEVNRFENGRLVSNSRGFRVVSNTANTVRIRVMSVGTVRVNEGEIFQLYDDDDFNDDDGMILDGDTGEDIPMSDTSLSLLTANSDDPTTNILAPIYVRPVYDVVDPRDNSFFQPNAFGDSPADTRRLFVDRDLTSTNIDVEFWTVYILGSYQHTLAEDNDPATELPTFGIADGIPLTALGDGSGVLIHLEVHNSKEIIDYPASPDLRRIANTVGHEVGHLLSGRHGDGDIMTDAFGVMTSNQFSPTTIRRIRAELTHP